MIRVHFTGLAALALMMLVAADVRAQRFDDFGTLRPAAAAPTAPDDAPPMFEPAPRRDKRISLTLSDGTRLVGKPSDLEELAFTTEYGELKVPIAKIDGLRFSDYPGGGGEHACGVHFTNGDVLSARLQLKSLKLDTLVGDVDVECRHVRSMVMSTDEKMWAQVGDAWKLLPAGSAVPCTAYSTPYASTPMYAPAPDGSYSTYSAPALAPSVGPAPSYPTTPVPEPSAPPRPLAPPMAR
jgi:hypothetical protein